MKKMDKLPLPPLGSNVYGLEVYRSLSDKPSSDFYLFQHLFGGKGKAMSEKNFTNSFAPILFVCLFESLYYNFS